MKNDTIASSRENETPRKPWVVPAATDALEPQDIANSYQLHQDSNSARQQRRFLTVERVFRTCSIQQPAD
ncbi:MAG: hypothetical protein WDN48_01585 [Pseudolabrys sp.]